MSKRIGSGALGGLIGGAALGAVLRFLPAAPLDSGRMSAAAFLARAIHLPGQSWLWLVLAGYGVVLGALFGALLPEGWLDQRPAMLRGGLYGLAWGIVASVVIVPVLARMMPLSAPAVDLVRPDAVPLLIGHVVDGVILGSVGAFVLGRVAARGDRRPAVHSTRRAA